MFKLIKIENSWNRSSAGKRRFFLFFFCTSRGLLFFAFRLDQSRWKSYTFRAVSSRKLVKTYHPPSYARKKNGEIETNIAANQNERVIAIKTWHLAITLWKIARSINCSRFHSFSIPRLNSSLHFITLLIKLKLL